MKRPTSGGVLAVSARLLAASLLPGFVLFFLGHRDGNDALTGAGMGLLGVAGMAAASYAAVVVAVGLLYVLFVGAVWFFRGQVGLRRRGIRRHLKALDRAVSAEEVERLLSELAELDPKYDDDVHARLLDVRFPHRQRLLPWASVVALEEIARNGADPLADAAWAELKGRTQGRPISWIAPLS
ncbi:MAG TPA: hypothetical protein VEJ18_10115 [Planctomycetota bacterium]|nr:hypothetical protein [Planctomycetota bacterium]